MEENNKKDLINQNTESPSSHDVDILDFSKMSSKNTGENEMEDSIDSYTNNKEVEVQEHTLSQSNDDADVRESSSKSEKNDESFFSKETPDVENTSMDESTKVYNVVHSTNPKKVKLPKKKTSGWGIFANVMTVIVILIVVGALIGGTIGITIANRIISDGPTLQINDFVSEESTVVYDDTGTEISELGAYLRQNITYDQCPESLVDAFLSIEDSRFFQHFGFDIPRFSAAIVANLKSHDFSQGGSTITMQLVKNTYFTIDAINEGKIAAKSIDRKVQEIALSIELEQSVDKKSIFELYVNKLNFGGNIRGVQKASIYYFDKEVTNLTLAESALLAGIVNSPNTFNPYENLDYGTTRRNEVLDMMAYHGYISQDECDLAKAIKVEDLLVGESHASSSTNSSQYQSYIDAVIEEAQKITGKDPNITGMSIYTYMNKTIQDRIEDIQESNTNVVFPDDLMQVAMVSMNNQTGAIVGIGGGRNYDGARLLNRATSQYKQPGSSVKPILSYALAFEYLGWSDEHILTDRPMTYPGESRVLVNFDGNYHGDVTIKDAIGHSYNIPAIETLADVVDKIGKEKVVNYMNSIGFKDVTNENFHLSFAIGGTWFESTCKEMAGAHAMIINGGVYNEPHTIEKIVMSDGTTYYPENQNRKVLSTGAAWLVSEMMENDVSGPYFNYMQLLKRDYSVYAKTGTTDWGSDGLQYNIPQGAAKDKWMISSTTQYTNAVWIGYDKGVKDAGTYFSAYKSSLNIPGNVSKLILDAEDEVMNGTFKAMEKPSDVEQITYVRGTYPYAYAEEWMDPGLIVTANVASANKPDLVSIYDHDSSNNTFNGVSASVDANGYLSVSWSMGEGACVGDQKDLSLHDGVNNIDAWGACLFDYAWLLGGNGGYYGAQVFVDDSYVGDITGENGSYGGYPGVWGGNVKVCGWYSSDTYTSETTCTNANYVEYIEPTYTENPEETYTEIPE